MQRVTTPPLSYTNPSTKPLDTKQIIGKKFSLNEVILIQGLQNKIAFNGQTGTITGFDGAKNRYIVRMGKTEILIKEENLEFSFSNKLFQKNEGVIIQGLQGNDDVYNGKEGLVVGLASANTYQVQLPETTLLVKQENLYQNGTPLDVVPSIVYSETAHHIFVATMVVTAGYLIYTVYDNKTKVDALDAIAGVIFLGSLLYMHRLENNLGFFESPPNIRKLSGSQWEGKRPIDTVLFTPIEPNHPRFYVIFTDPPPENLPLDTPSRTFCPIRHHISTCLQKGNYAFLTQESFQSLSPLQHPHTRGPLVPNRTYFLVEEYNNGKFVVKRC